MKKVESSLQMLLAFLDDDILMNADDAIRGAFKQKRIKGKNKEILADALDAEFRKRRI